MFDQSLEIWNNIQQISSEYIKLLCEHRRLLEDRSNIPFKILGEIEEQIKNNRVKYYYFLPELLKIDSIEYDTFKTDMLSYPEGDLKEFINKSFDILKNSNVDPLYCFQVYFLIMFLLRNEITTIQQFVSLSNDQIEELCQDRNKDFNLSLNIHRFIKDLHFNMKEKYMLSI